ncbi:MAG: ESX secretion-associated protein EspG [Kibdelosporangium sp.]
MTVTTDFELSTREFDFVWEHLELGRMPYPIDVPSNGATVEERDVMRAETMSGVRLDSRSTDLLRVLAAPTVSIDAVGFGDGPIRGLAATDGNQGVLVAIGGDRLSFAAIRPTALARSIVEVLPDGEPGTRNAISVPYQAMQRAVNGDDDDPFGDGDERDILMSNGVSDDDATMLIELADRRNRGGQFGVTTTSKATSVRAGVRTRAKTMITWFDTVEGRYLMVHDGAWVSIAPADAGRIAHRIDDLLRTASR